MIIQLTAEEWQETQNKLEMAEMLLKQANEREADLAKRVEALEEKIQWMKLPQCPEGLTFNTKTGYCE